MSKRGPKGIDWGSWAYRMGTVSDVDLAEEIGVWPDMVGRARRAMRIPAYRRGAARAGQRHGAVTPARIDEMSTLLKDLMRCVEVERAASARVSEVRAAIRARFPGVLERMGR